MLFDVIQAMQEKGYNPVSQLVGYLISGEPTYITAHNQARIKIQRIERDVLLQLMVEKFVNMGVDEISVPPAFVLPIRKIIREM